jgi:hypothetical protein
MDGNPSRAFNIQSVPIPFFLEFCLLGFVSMLFSQHALGFKAGLFGVGWHATT